MQSRFQNRSHTTKTWKLFKTGILPLVLFFALPLQALAADSCNPDLDFTIITPGPFFLGETLRISADMGAADIDGGGHMDIHAFGLALDCRPGEDFATCTSDDNEVQFLGNLSTNCINPDGAPVQLQFPQGGILPITTTDGPIRTSANSTCNVQFDFLVSGLNGVDNQIVQAMGWPVEGEPDTMCSNGGTTAANSTLAFNVHECGIEVQKEVSADGNTWFDADTAQLAPDLEVGATAYYRLVVTNTSTIAYAAPLVINDPQLGIVNQQVQGPFLGAGETAILTGNEISQLTKEGRCTVVGSLENTATVDAMCRAGNDPESASATDSAFLMCTEAPDPSINIVKTANPQTYASAGANINYSFEVTNTGNVPLSNVNVSDPLPGLSAPNCPRNALDAGESMTCTAFYSITQADVDAGRVDNLATATGTPPSGPDVSDSDPETITSTAGPAINILKSANPQTYSSAGTSITYTFAVTNTGGVTLNNVNVTDPLPGLSAPNCPMSTLLPNQSMDCSALYSTTQADVDAGRVDNLATAHGTPPSGPDVSDSDPETITATSSPTIDLLKVARPTTYSAVGERITYLFRVTNTSNVTLTNVNVTDPLPGITTPNCQTSTLTPGQRTFCRAFYDITQDDIDAGRVDNLATAHGTPPSGPDVTDTDPETITTTPAPALSLVKTATPTTYNAVGNVIDYSFLVTNTGNVTIDNLSVEDDKADDESCPVLILAPGESTTCTATYTITQADLDNGSVTNIAFATGTDPSDQPVTSPPDDETVFTVFEPALAIVKTATPQTYSSVGQIIDYDYLVTNTGNVTVNDLAVEDDKSDDEFCADQTLVPPEFTTCTATYTITQDDMDRGFVTNIAFAKGTITVPDDAAPIALRIEEVVSPPDDETITTTQTPALTIVKTATPQTYAAKDEVITYSFLVTNSGNVTINQPITIDDDKASDESCPAIPASLAPGESITCSASYTISQADVDAGSVTNIATATGECTVPNDCPVTSLPDDETVTYISTGCDLSVDLQCEVLQPDADPNDPPNPSESCVLFTNRELCEDRPTAFTFRYNQGDCSQSDNSQDPAQFVCTDFAPAGVGPFEVRISASRDPEYFIITGVLPGDEFEVLAADATRPPGGKFPPNSFAEIYENGVLVQRIRFHTSCSQNLYLGDKYGNLQITSFTYNGQVVTDLNDEVELYLTVTNTGTVGINYIELFDDNGTPVILTDDFIHADGTINDLVVPADFRFFMRTAQVAADATFTAYGSAETAGNPSLTCGDTDTLTVLVNSPTSPIASCEDGDPTALLFEYVGDDCSSTTNTQDGRVICEDFSVSSSDSDEILTRVADTKVTPSSDSIGVGDEVFLEVSGKARVLPKSTRLEITRGGETLQSLQIDTSCDSPLNVGDQFGGLILREYIPD